MPEPSPALAEMLAADGELDRILDGRGLVFERDDTAPPPLPAPLVIPPFDSSSFRDPVREPDRALHREDEESRPAKQRKRSTTPNLDRWRAEQVVADRSRT
jgi:hypothetical protein